MYYAWLPSAKYMDIKGHPAFFAFEADLCVRQYAESVFPVPQKVTLPIVLRNFISGSDACAEASRAVSMPGLPPERRGRNGISGVEKLKDDSLTFSSLFSVAHAHFLPKTGHNSLAVAVDAAS